MHHSTIRRRLMAAIATVVATAWLAGCGSATVSAPATKSTAPLPLTQTMRLSMQDPGLNAYVGRIVNSMSLDDRIGQMLYTQFFFYPNDPCTYDIASCIRTFHPGGMIVYQNSIDTVQDSRQLMQTVQQNSPIPMVLGTDNEGGAEDRLINIFPNGHPSAFAIGSTDSTSYAYQMGTQMAHDNLYVGLNANLAPVVDLDPTPQDRHFGTTPAEVIKMAGAWMQGMQDHGVIATLKHFPGLGNAVGGDPHVVLPTVYESRAQIENYDLAPYRALIDSNDPPGMVMSTDMMVPAFDAAALAELSYPIITGVLRDELHYDGVVITDALYMGGLGIFYDNGKDLRTDLTTLGHIGVLAVKAGDDMLLGSFSYDSTQAIIDGIKGALQSGELTMARINQSVTRVIRMKVQHGLIPYFPYSAPGSPPVAIVRPRQRARGRALVKAVAARRFHAVSAVIDGRPSPFADGEGRPFRRARSRLPPSPRCLRPAR